MAGLANGEPEPKERMTQRLYSLLMVLLQPLLRLKLARRGRQEPLYLEALEERFGDYADEPSTRPGELVWVHAVSLGETRTAALLVAALRQRFPDLRLLLTHGTATGRAEGKKLLRPGDLQTWQPWDTPAAVARFLHHFKPHIGILMETEIWPNLVLGCQQVGVPLVLANARMSEKTQGHSRCLGWLARPAYSSLRAVWAQTQDDAVRLVSLGASVHGVFGNLKFDATPDSAQLKQGRRWHVRVQRPVLLLASSRDGEEAALLQVLAALPGADPLRSVQWLLVPRHPQRFDAVAALVEQQGFALSRRSHWQDGPPEVVAPNQVTLWLGDTLGEMALYYALADVALLGGSFEPLGGQNLIEAAACACPLVLGPHTFNFAEAAELALAAGAALRADNLRDALAIALALVQDRERLQAVRKAAEAFAGSHQGATARLVQALAPMLEAGEATWSARR